LTYVTKKNTKKHNKRPPLTSAQAGPVGRRSRSEGKNASLKVLSIYVTSVLANLKTESVPQCWRKPKHKPCTGEIDA
jgi:hypothetical protein